MSTSFRQNYDGKGLHASIINALEDDSSELAAFFREFLQSPRTGIRVSSPEEVRKLVYELVDYGFAKGGSYPSIFLNADPSLLQKVAKHFEDLNYGRRIDEYAARETPRELQRLYVAVTYAGWNPARFYAFLCYDALRGPKPDVKALIRAIVPQSETILKKIIALYPHLKDDVEDCLWPKHDSPVPNPGEEALLAVRLGLTKLLRGNQRRY